MERYGYSAARGRRPAGARPAARFANGGVLAIAIAALAAAIAGCGGGTGAAKRLETARLVDEAFAALFPEAWARLGELPDAAPQSLGPAARDAADAPAPIALQSMAQAADRVLARLPRDGAEGDGKPQGAPKTIIASPLAAERLIAAAGKAGARLPPLVVPFASSFGLSGGVVREVRYNYPTAYAAMGRRAAAAVEKLPPRAGARPTCGVVFQENFMRGGDALEAFSAAFSAASGEPPIVSILDARAAVDPTGAARAAVAELMDGDARAKIGILILAVDDAAIADEAAGKAGEIEVFADASSWGERGPDARLYRAAIRGDETGLAKAAEKAARRLASGRETPALTLVQLRLRTVFPKIF